MATYEGGGSVDDAKAKFRASVERSFKVATVGVDVKGGSEKTLAETHEKWRVEVNYTIIGAGEISTACKLTCGGYLHD